MVAWTTPQLEVECTGPGDRTVVEVRGGRCQEALQGLASGAGGQGCPLQRRQRAPLSRAPAGVGEGRVTGEPTSQFSGEKSCFIPRVSSE